MLARLDGDEGGTQGHLRLAEAHIAAHNPIHGFARGKVADDLLDSLCLIGCFFEGKCSFERTQICLARLQLCPLARGAA